MKIMLRPEARVAVAAALTTALQTAFAADEFKLSAAASLISHSNAALQDEDKRSDTERVVHADVGYQHADDGLFSAGLGYSVDRRDFLHEVQSDETAINGSANALLHMIENRLDAILQNQVSQSLIDRRDVDVTNNQERRIVTTIGLDGYAHLSAVDALVLSPRFTDVNLQKSTDSDSQRSVVSLAWQHRTNSFSQAYLSGSYGKVRFDDSINNYDSSTVQVGYKTALARLSYQAAVGFSRFDREHGDSVDGYLAQLGVDYKGEGYAWGGALVHELTDTSVGLSGAEFTLGNFQAQDSNFDQPDIIHRTQFDIYGQRQLGRDSRLDASAGYHKDTYDRLPRDEQGYYAQVGYQYSINVSWSLGASIRYEDTHFLNEPNDFRYNETTSGIFVGYRWSPKFDVRFDVSRRKRNSDEVFNRFTDNQVSVGVSYHFF